MRPKSKTHLNSRLKPSAKGKVGKDIRVGDSFRADNGSEFTIVKIDPEDNLPYFASWTNLGWDSTSYLSYTFIKTCERC